MLLFQADIVNIIKEVKSIEVVFGMKTITLEVNGSDTFASVKEQLADMEGIEAETLAMLTFQGKQRADEQLLGNIDNIQPNGSRFYATRRLRGGGVRKGTVKKNEKVAFAKVKTDMARASITTASLRSDVFAVAEKKYLEVMNENAGDIIKDAIDNMEHGCSGNSNGND